MLTSENDERNHSFASSMGEADRHNEQNQSGDDDDDGQRHNEPPPASWFSQYTTITSNRSVSGSGDTEAKKPSSDDNVPTEYGRKIRSISTGSGMASDADAAATTNTDWGMVSDNEDDEGFNFVAVSKSLLMASRSFEHFPSSSSNGNDSDSEQRGGVLIVDGSEDIAADSNANINDASDALTIPGSDSLPSDLGTISQDNDEPLFGEGSDEDNHHEGRLREQEDPYHRSYPPLVHRFLRNLKENRRRQQKDCESVHQYDHDEDRSGWPLASRRFRGFSVVNVACFALVTTLVALLSWAGRLHRLQQEAWQQQLLKEGEEKAYLLAEQENLRLELDHLRKESREIIELLQEEAAVASARADSLAKEQERLRLLQEETERADLRWQQEENQDCRNRRSNNYPNEDDDFSWFFNEDEKDSTSRSAKEGSRDDGSTTFTIADNCWFKAKADFNFGSCGGDTKQFFSEIWNGLWDWDSYFDLGMVGDAMEPYVSSNTGNEEGTGNTQDPRRNDYYGIGTGSDDDYHQYHYQDDTYYPPQDPLQELYSVIQSFGQTFASKFSQLMTNETAHTQGTAKDLRDATSRGHSDETKTVSDVMEAAKDGMRGLSKEALSTLRTAVKNNNKGTADGEPRSPTDKQEEQENPSFNKESFIGDEQGTTKGSSTVSSTTQPVTLKGLFDAATALSSFSKAWQEAASSLSDSDIVREEDIISE